MTATAQGSGLFTRKRVVLSKAELRRRLKRLRERAHAQWGTGILRPANKMPATFNWDLVELKKLVILCELCGPKFDPARNRYQRDRLTHGNVDGFCDGCREHGAHHSMYTSQEMVDERGNFRFLPQ